MKSPPLNLIGSFLAFAQSKNMSEAAHLLGLSQPALTSHLKQFEDYFPQDIFTMEGRKKVLTSFGEQLKDLLAHRFGDLNLEIKALNEKFQSPEQVAVRIAGRSEILNLVAPRIDFAGTLLFLEADGQSAVAGVLKRQFDLAISNHTAKADQLLAKKLFADQFQVLIPRKWNQKLATEKKQLTSSLMQELLEQPYLGYKEKDPALQALLDHFKIEAPAKINRALSSWPHLIQMVEQAQGWTLAPTRYAVHSSLVNTFTVATHIIPETQFYALYRKESSHLSWFKTLLEQIKQKAFTES